MKIKLPKQWLYWCKCAGLKPTSSRTSYSAFYLIGRGRYWRVYANGEFEISEPINDFDRWANSGGPCLPLPKNHVDFMKAVTSLEKLAVSGIQ